MMIQIRGGKMHRIERSLLAWRHHVPTMRAGLDRQAATRKEVHEWAQTDCEQYERDHGDSDIGVISFEDAIGA